ncbi:hypothetical protein BPO_0216 [Bergeyella porcorum]|uniref:Phosphoribosylaminoimidazolesuccinocarboxamide synthase n=1 Tax=Bergeyella porcorum TaxID=1735111 RepID=A0AAU0F0E0_9FLAO
MKTFKNNRITLTNDGTYLRISESLFYKVVNIILGFFGIIFSITNLYNQDFQLSGFGIFYYLILALWLYIIIAELTADTNNEIRLSEIKKVNFKERKLLQNVAVSILYQDKKRKLGVFTSEDAYDLRRFFKTIQDESH